MIIPTIWFTNLVFLVLFAGLFFLLLLFLRLLLLRLFRRTLSTTAFLFLSSRLLLLLDALDTGVKTQSEVHKTAQLGRVLLFSACALRLVFLFRVTFVVTAKKSNQKRM
jgi:hypothetical protein